MKLETPFYKVCFNEDGSISSLIYKQDNGEIVGKSHTFNKLKIYKDYPGMYDAWDILENYKERQESYTVIKALRVY